MGDIKTLDMELASEWYELFGGEDEAEETLPVEASDKPLEVVLNGVATTVAGEAKTTLIRNYRALYEHLIDDGWTEAETIVALIQKSQMVDEEVVFEEEDSKKYSTGLRVQYPLEHIKEVVPEWDSLKNHVKLKALSRLGFDTQGYNVYSTLALYRDKHNKTHYGEVLYCQERTDWWWSRYRVNGSLVASVDSIAVASKGKWGYDFRRDLV